MSALKLTLTKNWFDLILSGKKKSEFREHKKHWIQRLSNPDGSFKTYDEIEFTNGYGADRPFMRAKFEGVSIGQGRDLKPNNKEPITKDGLYYEISIGPIIETRNIKDGDK